MKLQENVTNETNEAKNGHISFTLTKTTGCLDKVFTVEISRDYLITVEELARYTGFKKGYWYKRISGKTMPSEIQVHKFSRRAVKVWKSGVDAWIERHKVDVNQRTFKVKDAV